VSTRTALVIDDNADVRLLLRFALEPAGFEVSEAVGGPAALAALASDGPPDVVVLDVQMPEMDGWDTLRAIRADPSTADVPVVLCTVKSTPTDVERGAELGCDGYLTKPFDIRTVVTAVGAAMAARSNRPREESECRSEH
jgi:CheY-like chemotaxis protein